jgi:hypothetical protein
MEFLEAPAFTRYVSGYLTDDGYRELQNRLAAAPEHGDVIPGTGGFRKLRWATQDVAKDEEAVCE